MRITCSNGDKTKIKIARRNIVRVYSPTRASFARWCMVVNAERVKSKRSFVPLSWFFYEEL